ncbi:conjugal transfer protein TraD [Rhizobium halophytocola]|uniref:Conjugal transfer protein TraD n=1 Tax=Rhizobium halophytocola TaxID=735519 RepID=A0ABS4E4H9_9HYPH|nr:conjugal transfer protein TraD [Rhizobium halophytocola]MBP1852827.1 hypothetical protein [Rhizobium halophytocola]
MARIQSANARKKDTREKIALGGLVVKAGLRDEKPALLLGALLELKQQLEAKQSERQRLMAIGARAFDKDRD